LLQGWPRSEQQRPVGWVDDPRDWHEFETWFTDETACRDFRERLRWPEGFVYLACGGGQATCRHARRNPKPRRLSTRRRQLGTKMNSALRSTIARQLGHEWELAQMMPQAPVGPRRTSRRVSPQ
jgi:hypothetical protein